MKHQEQWGKVYIPDSSPSPWAAQGVLAGLWRAGLSWSGEIKIAATCSSVL
jgi:hypothetical protein